ncbi:Ig-like domain-containing protein [Methanobrevibacter sp.]|uniref:Ig-like domain-containing protein n=1 Tax=Methanobrevibacter sp. TaxID=66852 RepID=UPI0025F65A8A|nr:Ig-like domain-containing protein [Methanobrevibacter sp.]MBR4447780.1 Ig-like domain-containing protein [Methanobrevibacter sp.]
MNKKIILAILAIIIIAILGLMVFSQTSDSKLNTQINFLSDTDLQNGDQVEIELTDEQGNALPNEPVNFTIVENGVAQTYSVYTNNEGKAFLILNDENPGDYEITASFGGNDNLNPCTAKQTITIGEDTNTDAVSSSNVNSTTSSSTNNDGNSTSSQSQSSKSYYDEELNEYYDENGIIIGGQNDGSSIDDVKNNPQEIDEEGNLV